MKLTKTSKSLLLTGGMLLAFVVWQHHNSTEQCQSAAKVCPESQHNWVKWLAGDSRSAQFHFVDFLELINGLLPAKSPKS